jgi:hypothetical protein
MHSYISKYQSFLHYVHWHSHRRIESMKISAAAAVELDSGSHKWKCQVRRSE